MKPFLVADLFCGAGGSSTGARLALSAMGRSMRLVAVNHWARAIETHTKNHPDAEHFCVDVYKTSPREAVPGGRLDLLMASPTCTFFSTARGGKPISFDQRWGRMTPTQVLRWLTDLDVGALLVENVPEFMAWGPVHRAAPALPSAACADAGCRPEKPCRRKRGVYFRAWLRRIVGLGYQLEHRVLNAADFGDATTRQRFFLIARKNGRPIVWPAPSHSKDGAGDLFGTRKRWRAAREIIDWSIPGTSIFGRKRPLSPKTIARIYAGAVRFGWPEAFLVVLRRHMEKDAAREPVPGITTSTGGGVFLVEPLIIPQGGGGAAREVAQPVATIATDGAHALVSPYYGTGVARPVSSPLPTATTRDRFGLVMPVTHADTSQRARAIEEPIPTVTAARRGELAFITATFGERKGQRARVRSVESPVPTLCATGYVPLVEGQAEPVVDVLFRMLQPHELAAAMGFDGEAPYEFCGTKEEITRQIGNAVPVRTSAALVGAILGARAAAEVA